MSMFTRCTEEVTSQLRQTASNRVERDGILATRLCTHKDDVELTNARRLQQLPGKNVVAASAGTNGMFLQGTGRLPTTVKAVDDGSCLGRGILGEGRL